MKEDQTMRRGTSSPTRSLLQKVYGNPKPVREYKRFPRSKQADTGMDPKGAAMEFIKNDIIRPLERIKDEKAEKIIFDNDKWAVGTTKKCSTLEKLPRLQPYRDYNFPDKSDKDKEQYKSYFHKTDNISIRVPKIKRKEESESFLNLKSKFGPHTETYKEGWVPQGNFKTMNNRSSVSYNIISCDNNANHSGAVILKILDKKLANKKKGITEFVDKSLPYNPNINKKFRDFYENNNKIFNVYNGIFSHMYDAAHRNGNMAVPFRNNSNYDSSSGFQNNANNSRTTSPNRIRNKSSY